MKLLPVGLALSMLCGCATWTPETEIEESTFLTLHAVDGLQTAHIASTHHGCDGQIRCQEIESAWAIGCEPSARSTAGYFAAIAIAHVAVTQLLVHYDAPPWALRTWEIIGIAWNVRDVSHNAALGINLTNR